MTDPTFGISIRRVEEEPRPVLGADLSTVGIVGPAEGADPEEFPLNIPVVVRTNDAALIRKLGTQGYIHDALNAIGDQLGELEAAARTIVVRTKEGTSEDPAEKLNQTLANIVGSVADGSGIHALLKAPSMVGFTPRIIIVPGYTGQISLHDVIGRIVQLSGGSGYRPGRSYALAFSGGNPRTPAEAYAIGMDDGSLGDAQIEHPGDGYEEAPTITAPTPGDDENEEEATFDAGMEVGAIIRVNGGSGYEPGESYELTFTGGTPTTPATGHAIANDDGTLGEGEIDEPGDGYRTPPAVAAPAPPPPENRQALFMARMAIDAITNTSGGEGYEPDQSYELVITGGGTPTVPAQAHAIADDDGHLGEAIIDEPGAGYTARPNVMGPTGAGITPAAFNAFMALDEIVTTDGGAGYEPEQSYPLNFAGGAPTTPAVAHVIADEDGELGDAVIDEPGGGFTSAPSISAPMPPASTQGTTATYSSHLSVGAVHRIEAGAGYEAGVSYELTFVGGEATTPARAHAVALADGSLDDAEIDYPGDGYTEPPDVTAPAPPPGAGGERATYRAYMAVGANPVCASLTAVLNNLMGHGIVESSGVSQQNDFDWRETIQSERLIPISGGVKVLDDRTGVIVTRPLAGRIAGVGVRRDHEKGAPFHSWANQPVQGIIAPAREIGFSLTDGENEAQELLAANIGVLVRGEVGSDFAIATGGFVFIGTDNAGEDELWRMYNVRRGRDYIHLGLLRAMRWYLGRFNITGQTVQAILNTMGFFLRDLQADDHILGYKVAFTSESNSAEKIRLGKLTVAFAAEEPPVLKHLTMESARYRPAIDAMIAQLERQLNLAA